MEFKIGLDAITSYRRLAYTPWHAIAEFVDNSTQAYFNNREILDKEFEKEGTILTVSIAYDNKDDLLRIADNSIGMNEKELNKALHVSSVPENTSGRSKYGMGLKTASCWVGNHWTVRTKKLGETKEYEVVVDVNKISNGDASLPLKVNEGKPADSHYTVVEIKQHNKIFKGRTLGKIETFLSSMYRQDLREGILNLSWRGIDLKWDSLDGRLLKAPDGTMYKKKFDFVVDGKKVRGWVGILDKGGRADAGFSILHAGRMVRGWPDSWRPTALYGQLLGSNDLVNQRLVGEIHLDEFDVSHTKDDIQWVSDQLDEVEEKLYEACKDYRQRAKDRRKNEDDSRGPTEEETEVAVSEIIKELESEELLDHIKLAEVPSEDLIKQSKEMIRGSATSEEPTFQVNVAQLLVKCYMGMSLSINDPYVEIDSTMSNEVMVIINRNHPHWGYLKGSDGVANFLRHCIYDGIAQWQAQTQAARIDPDTIKLLKDRLLRTPFEIEAHQADQSD